MVRKKIDRELPRKAILWWLHQSIIDKNTQPLTPERFASKLRLSLQLVEIAINSLEVDELCTTKSVDRWAMQGFSGEPEKIVDTIVSITNGGIEYVENWDDETHDNVIMEIFPGALAYQEDIDKYLSETEKQKSPINVPLNIPASDRTVPLTDNQREEALEVIGSVIEAVRGDNEYGDRDPEDKEQRLAELSASKELFKATRISISTVEPVLIKTLVYLSGIGVAVSQIADAIIKIQTLLGH